MFLWMCASLCVFMGFANAMGNNVSIDNSLTMGIDELQFGKSINRGNMPRNARLISFQSTDDDIEISLEFGVPFIKIPVKKALNNFQQGFPVANVNFGGAILAGAIGLGALVIVPGVIKFFSPPTTGFAGPYSRALPDNSEWWRVVQGVEETLLANNIDSSVCMQKAVCSVVKDSTVKVDTGKAQSMEKLIDGLASNSWVKQFINGTSIQSAIDEGYKKNDCGNLYATCKLNEMSLSNMMKKLSHYIIRK